MAQAEGGVFAVVADSLDGVGGGHLTGVADGDFARVALADQEGVEIDLG